MKYFIGIDPSLTATGFCCLNESGKAVLTTIKIPKETSTIRLDQLERAVLATISPFKGVDTLVAIEGYSFSSKFSHAHSLGEWGGVLRLALYRAGLKYVDVPPMTLKKFVTGKGNAKKNTMLMAVYKKWGVECADDNQGDAYSLAQFIRTGQTVPVKAKKKKKELENV